MRAHKLEKKSAKRKRGFRKVVELAKADVREASRLLGGISRKDS